jgi:transcriptional regulator with XRE-family HTH domain
MEELNKQIGQRFAIFRKTIGLSQKSIAEKAGLNRVNINRMEMGKFNPSFNTIIHILQTYKISIDWLLTGNGQMFLIDEDHTVNKLKDYHLAFLEKLVSMPAEKQHRLINAFSEILETD